MNKEEINVEIDQFMSKFMDFLGNLKDRWDDEKEYEDWKDYEKVIREKLSDYNIVKVLKVGVTYELNGFDFTYKANKSGVAVTVKG